MATHSSIVAWKISWMEPGRLQSMGLQRVGHNWATSFQGGLRPSNREGTQPCPCKDLLNLAPPIRTRPSFHLSQYLPSGSFYASEGRQNENHNHRKLIKLISWTTALSNSMKLWAVPCKATQDGWVMVESLDKMWSTGEGDGKPLQYSCLENPMNSMKMQKDRTLKDELPRSVGAQYATGEQWRNKSMKRRSQS